ncbi:Ger(x)C family spore germination protein [Risungbinella massiliensis]|uniref:Ger(x)C family spore germination protein n=1 Tax=Risungbinella massiliensis TaxID=1329796 RepID=UPI0005CC23AA|nr:Ger(x)C family spore germination protein [Risungbinella massiliensis]
MRKWIRAFCIILLVCTSGCLPTYTIEDIQIMQAVGYDYVDEESISGTASVGVYTPSEGQASLEGETFHVIGRNTREIQRKMNLESPRPLVNGKLSVVLISDQLAQRGFREIIDSYAREPDISRKMYLAIVEGNTKEMLEGDYKLTQSVTQYIKNQLDQNLERNFPTTNIHEFLNAYFGKGKDPFLPLLSTKGNKIEISGFAVFKDDQLIEKIHSKSFLLKTLIEGFETGAYDASVENDLISFDNIGSAVHIGYSKSKGTPQFQIKVKIKGQYEEAKNKSFVKTTDIKGLEKQVKKSLEEELTSLVRHFQEIKVDPLGLGNIARSQDRNWNEKTFYQQYPKIPIKVDVDFQLLEIGIIDDGKEYK